MGSIPDSMYMEKKKRVIVSMYSIKIVDVLNFILIISLQWMEAGGRRLRLSSGCDAFF
jgi:hypothetical protein